MEHRATKMKLLFICWLLFVPTGIIVAYQFYPSEPMVPYLIVAFLVFAGIVSYFPIIINETPIFLTQWITLVAFLLHGLFYEILFLQFSIIMLMFSLKIKKDELYRYFLNSVMFLIVSLVSGITFYAVGGEIGNNTFSDLIVPLIVYQIVNFIANQILYHWTGIFLGKKERFFAKNMLWDFFTLTMVFPLGVGLYFLFNNIGYVAFLIIGIPFISFAYVLRMYNSSERINEYLQRAAEIGHQLTERLQVNEVLDLFIQKISQVLPVDYAYILDVMNDELVLLRGVEKGEQNLDIMPAIKRNQGISGVVWGTGKAVLYNEKTEWENESYGYMPEGAESILCVPIFRRKKVEGVLFLVSTKKKQYEKFQIPMIDILCSYFIVAIQNAKHYEKTKMMSEHCQLTKLYNYRYFEELLSHEFDLLSKGQRNGLSLIMLDIDYFKSVNDTYGHQSGNEILVQMAKRIKSLIGNRGTVARYGGEEFVILLPDTNKQSALRLAEIVRLTIANRPFATQNFLDIGVKHESISITVSIGVATAPQDADDSLALIRHADRALYIGAKRAGKNRVAEYVK
ncbi:sensor domain-containing diguanylate cyclase [Heyndrickxia vini]|uniref:Sensor domain-containing diguanylate cyclase n=1 Tax=Heyndrickxia vini TaxID=1476025 RepID=A0ABX7E4P8_9BACI|nr:sensor domain-containing diguanylate cyclase [Heyndrickxia vini]QQZ10698.1 sensor domain-containing diguanylate cyclase [Heyndrickxia vini]